MAPVPNRRGAPRFDDAIDPSRVARASSRRSFACCAEQPGAARSGWAGKYGADALRLRLAAPPVEGRANRACVAFLAAALGVPERCVRIVHGETSRRKVVRITPVSPQQFQALQQAWNS